MAEIVATQGIGEGGDVVFELREERVEFRPPAGGVGSRELIDVGDCAGGSVRRGWSAVPRFVGGELIAGEVFDAFGEGGELEGERPGVGLVGEQQVEHRGRLDVSHVPPAVGHGAIGDFQDASSKGASGPRATVTRVPRSNPPVCSDRSSRRPMSRNRHPWPRVMLSAINPLNAARPRILRSRPSR